MPHPSRGADALEQIVDLQHVRQAVTAPEERRRLARVIRALRAQVDVGVPKHRAAGLLDVSPQALERWVRGDRIPTTRRPGSSRELIDRDALIRLLAHTQALTDAGERRPLARAIAVLSAQGRLERRPAPNQSARELRYEYECTRSSPANRVRSAVALSQTTIAMAARAPARRRASN